jgi:2'-5' RNA ligase
LFFALWPSDETRAELAEACRPALQVAAGRAVPKQYYHVTLAFLGDQPAGQVERLDVMASVAPPEFELVLDRFGHWRGPRVVWIGPSECPDGLAMLVTQIRAELDGLDISYDSRDFRPHLTLARKVMTLPELKTPAPVHWPVRTFVLVESVAMSDGPIYRVVRRFALGSLSGGSFPGGSRHDPKQG